MIETVETFLHEGKTMKRVAIRAFAVSSVSRLVRVYTIFSLFKDWELQSEYMAGKIDFLNFLVLEISHILQYLLTKNSMARAFDNYIINVKELE